MVYPECRVTSKSVGITRISLTILCCNIGQPVKPNLRVSSIGAFDMFRLTSLRRVIEFTDASRVLDCTDGPYETISDITLLHAIKCKIYSKPFLTLNSIQVAYAT